MKVKATLLRAGIFFKKMEVKDNILPAVSGMVSQ